MSLTGVDLGFAEICDDSWRLLSHYFPSKLGGSPAWLSFECLPGYEKLKCHSCENTCKFLMQLYSPGTNDFSFHRTLFIFICSEECCSNRKFLCFRSQLPKANKFYSDQPPNDSFFDSSQKYPSAKDYHTLCEVCLCKATKLCSRCRSVSYCTQKHQTADWKSGHKNICSLKDKSIENPTRCNPAYFFREYEIVCEPELVEKEHDNELYKKYLQKVETDDSMSSSDWEAVQEVTVADKAFLKFREKISKEPDQIIRYQKGGLPLLVSDEFKPPEVVPPCSSCGGPREFEFQILPQTLSYLNLNNTAANCLDWGTLIVYTCKSSCDIRGYAEEFVYSQNLSNKDLVKKGT